MKEFMVEWYVSGYCGSFRYSVVANSLEEAEIIWNEFVSTNDDLSYSWENAKRGVKNHYGGFIRWKEIGKSNKESGCYEMEFDYWNASSDHLMD